MGVVLFARRPKLATPHVVARTPENLMSDMQYITGVVWILGNLRRRRRCLLGQLARAQPPSYLPDQLGFRYHPLLPHPGGVGFLRPRVRQTDSSHYPNFLHTSTRLLTSNHYPPPPPFQKKTFGGYGCHRSIPPIDRRSHHGSWARRFCCRFMR